MKEGGKKFIPVHVGTVIQKKLQRSPIHRSKKLTPAKPGSNGKNVTMCSLCKTVLKQVKINAPKTVKLSKDHYSYDGKAKKPAIKVTDNKGKVISGKLL